ncbi:MAG TPA: response regulator [Euryarchaeota archaeon]|nr:putative transcriptional regulatory protein TcrX [archaeon BMS3Abin16]HDH28906.1 response regulator [Euryarchaeota archaeon]HDY73731.1 response regulator [Euryarchaeota archaeon]
MTVLEGELEAKRNSNVHILLVDDEPDFLVVMSRLLHKHGYMVSEASNGRRALEIARNEHPDAILLDVMMTDKNGWDVCRALKSNPETRDLPIIMLTVMAEDESVKRSFKYAGADWHITKPFDIDLLFFILQMASNRDGKPMLEKKIASLIKKNRKMKKVLEMINPKLIDRNYDFLAKKPKN